MDNLIERVQYLAALAKKQNLDGFEVSAHVDKGFSVGARQGAVDNVEHHQENSLGITVYSAQKSGNASTSDFSPEALCATLDKACTIAKYTEPDLFSGLAEKKLMAFNYPDLSLHHPWDISPAQAIDLALQCDESARAFDDKISQTEEATVTTSAHSRVYMNSHGFLGHYSSSLHGLSISVVAQHQGQMERDYDSFYVRDATHFVDPSTLAKQAAERALMRLGAKKVGSQQCAVIFEARVAKSLLTHCIAALSGTNLYRKTSFLVDRLGDKIFPEFVTLGQYPHIKGGYGSIPFDDQGVLTRDLNYIDKGVLQHYVLGAYSARKLGLETTGNAGGVFNLEISHSDLSLKDLCKKMHTGLLVTELMGQGVNLVTGEYSRGVSGFWVDHGEIQHPVNETTVAANLKDMFINLVAVGNDLDLRGNIKTGSILIESMMIA